MAGLINYSSFIVAKPVDFHTGPKYKYSYNTPTVHYDTEYRTHTILFTLSSVIQSYCNTYSK